MERPTLMQSNKRWTTQGAQTAPVAPGDIKVPQAVSKSMMRAMGCETYFGYHYLLRDSPVRLIDSPLAQTGTDFHAWRASYIQHLLEDGLPADREWAAQWLAGAVITDDARELVSDDMTSYGVDPDAIFGTELFLSIDAEGLPLELESGTGQQPGRVTEDPRGVASGSIDVLELRGDTALVTDYKSGWAVAGVSDFEPPVYAALVFAHFPQVERVDFKWEFVRLRGEKNVSYERSQFPELLDMVLQARQRAADIARRFGAGAALKVNPWAGLCGFCALRCPLRAAVAGGMLALAPIQTDDDARSAAALLYAARQLTERATEVLKPWLAERKTMALGGDFVLELDAQTVTKKPLLKTLEVLGYDVSGMTGTSPAFDVPLEKLTIGGLSGYAKAKKRAGLRDRLDKVSARSVKTVLTVRRVSGGSELLEAPAGEDAA